jgi:hypothetical protein
LYKSFVFIASGLPLRVNQPFARWIPKALSIRVMWPGREAQRSSASSAGFKYPSMTWFLNEDRDALRMKAVAEQRCCRWCKQAHRRKIKKACRPWGERGGGYGSNRRGEVGPQERLQTTSHIQLATLSTSVGILRTCRGFLNCQRAGCCQMFVFCFSSMTSLVMKTCFNSSCAGEKRVML